MIKDIEGKDIMKATIVVDNIPNVGLEGEWGLCVYVEYEDKKILLDTGASNLFETNANRLKLSIKDVDYAVLSHAHYDHANGMRKFFELNDHAKFYVQDKTAENCYFKFAFVRKYIGIPKGIMAEYADRFAYVSGIYKLCEGVSIVSHSTPNLEKIGKREHMYQKTAQGFKPDNFCHEQSLVFETEKGLVIMNSCSHGGASNIIREVAAAFPDKKVYALIGGFHIFKRPEAEIRKLAQEIKETGIAYVCTGHCSRERGYQILKEELGDIMHQLKVGLVMEF